MQSAADVRAQAPGDGRDHLVHGLVALDRHQVRHVHGADLAHEAEVVAQQVGDHQVLGAVLLARPQLLAEAASSAGCGRGAGALDRLGLHPAVAPDAQEALGRRAEHGGVAEAQVGRERRRVDVAQRPVGGERLGRHVGGDLVREADLVGLALDEVLLGCAGCPRGTARASGSAGTRRAPRPRLRQSTGERRQRFEAAARLAIQRRPRLGARVGEAERRRSLPRRGRRRSAGRRTRTRRPAATTVRQVALAVGLELVAEVADEAAVEVERQVPSSS